MQLQSNARRQAANSQRQRGVTLVESSVVLSIIAVLGGIAAPSFDGSMQRRHLEGSAAQLETDIHFARMLAVARNAPLRISFSQGAAGSCYVIHTGAANQCACDATGKAQCQAGAAAERAVLFAAGDAVAIQSNSRSVLFDPQRGTTTPTVTVKLTSRNGQAIHQIVNVVGRVRSCSPAPGLSGYRAC